MINIKDIKQDAFSFNNEKFYDFEPEYFLLEDNISVGLVFYAGVKEVIKPSRFFDIEVLIEHMSESASCEFGDYAEDFLCDVNEKRKLDQKISELLDEYLPKPSFYNVVDTVKYRIVKIDGDEIYVEELQESNNS